MKHVLTSLFVMIICGFGALGQTDKNQTQALEQALAKKEIPLPVSTVNSSVSVEAVLIPYKDARRIFGSPVALNYAVVELNIGNKSPDAELLIQNVFIDYSKWVFSGMPHDRRLLQPQPDSRFSEYQTSANPGRVAAEESRTVRDRLENASMFSGRSWAMRALDLASTIAGAYPFGLSVVERKYFGVFTAHVVPGIKTLWPDDTQHQMLRVTDYGFSSKRHISRNGADIVVCFFPIDRFLSPGFRDLYLKKPALFFAPLLMLVDRTVKNDVAKVLGKDLGVNLAPEHMDTLRAKMPCYIKLRIPIEGDRMGGLLTSQCLNDFGLELDPNKQRDSDSNKPKDIRDPSNWRIKPDQPSKDAFRDFIILDYLAQSSLNSIFITVDGVMTLDTSAFAAKIDQVQFDDVDGCGDATKACFWTEASRNDGVRTGTISGSYLTGGTIDIAEGKDLGISPPTLTADKSNDQLIHFSFKLSKRVDSGKKLTFTVNKTETIPNASGAAKQLNSAAKVIDVTYQDDTPTIDENGIEVNYGAMAAELMKPPKTITIKGKNLSSSDGATITLHTPSGEDRDATPNPKPLAFPVTIPLPADTQPFGCWKVKIKVRGKDVEQSFAVAPGVEAKISGTGNDKKLIVSGTFLNVKDCQTPPQGLEFHAEKNGVLVDLVPTADQITSKTITVPLTGKAADVDDGWVLNVTFNKIKLKNSPINLTH